MNTNNTRDSGAGRSISLSRTSRETAILLRLDLDGRAEAADKYTETKIEVKTGIGFLDHMLTALATHAGWSLELYCEGDLGVDDHHTAEDCAILLGEALRRILSGSGRIARFGFAYAPLDESLARAVVDISGRPYCVAELGLERPSVGDLATENLRHVFESFAFAAKMNLHIDLLRGGNDHHRAEAAFKALALALGMALAPFGMPVRDAGGAGVAGFASTKGGVKLEELEASEWEGRKGAKP